MINYILLNSKEEINVKKILSLILAILMIASVTSAMAEAVKMDKLTLEFVPSKDADVIITGTQNLPELLQSRNAQPGL